MTAKSSPISSALSILKEIVVEVATLARPVTAAAVAGLVITLIPGIGIEPTALAGILVAVGVGAAFIEKIISKV